MVDFENVLKSEIHIGLSSFKLDKKNQRRIYKNKYNSFLFKTDVVLPFKNSIYIIDQILGCR